MKRASVTRLVIACICSLAPLGGTLLLSGCGDSSRAASRTVNDVAVGESLRLANCTNWRSATVAQRKLTVEQLQKFAGGRVGSSAGMKTGPILSNDRAYKLFQKACVHAYARGFKLYKLYEHAAAFVGIPTSPAK
jgi:hypothetical protein